MHKVLGKLLKTWIFWVLFALTVPTLGVSVYAHHHHAMSHVSSIVLCRSPADSLAHFKGRVALESLGQSCALVAPQEVDLAGGRVVVAGIEIGPAPGTHNPPMMNIMEVHYYNGWDRNHRYYTTGVPVKYTTH